MHRLRYLVGALTLIAAVVGSVWIVRVLRNLDDRPGLVLQVEFREARGLRAGADVRFRGVTVGSVRQVAIAGDGSKAVAHLVLQPAGAQHACVNSSFWIVTPRFGGLTDGASGLDTLVRDSYLAFQTPTERGSLLTHGSLLAGRERPPAAAEAESLEEISHGDLLMTLLVPENHGLRPGSAVMFRGMRTGDVRGVGLAPAGSHVEVTLRIARAHRQTVTDMTVFWVARPKVEGSLLSGSGFSVADFDSLLSPYVGYYTAPGKGVLVQDGYRAAARGNRPEFEASGVPADALLQAPPTAKPTGDEFVLGRISYSAIERDTWSPDDPIERQGSGLLFLDRSGRAVVVTARSLVDGSFTERDLFGGDPDIDDEQIKVLLANGSVLRAGRVWVDPKGGDMAALVIEAVPPNWFGTAATRLLFAGIADGPMTLRAAGPDGLPLAPAEGSEALGGAVCVGDRVIGIQGRGREVFALERLPEDLRPQ